jgi:hypothetical protein
VNIVRILVALAVAPTLGFLAVITVYYDLDPIEKPADGVEGYLFFAALPVAYLFALVISWPLAHWIRRRRAAYLWIPLAGGTASALFGVLLLSFRVALYLFLFGTLTTVGFWLIGLADWRSSQSPEHAQRFPG